MGTIIALLASLEGAADEMDQAVALLARSGIPDAERLPLAEGDRRLLALCRTATGEDLEMVAACPHCGGRSTLSLSPEVVPPASPRSALLGPGGGLREPTYDDLRSLPADPSVALQQLLARCVVGSPARAPRAEDLDLVDDSLSGPVVVSCTECGETVVVDVDVECAILQRLARRAREVDREVHQLASAYHWSLAEIESLGDERRRLLADLVAET